MSLTNHFFPVRRGFSIQEPQSTWTIDHNLGRTPSVAVSVHYSGQLVVCIPQSVQHVTENQVVITFPTPQTGEVRIS